MRIILALLLCYVSVGAHTPRSYQSWDLGDGRVGVQFGGHIQNYKDGNSWHPIENDWVLNGDSMYVAWNAALKATVDSLGDVIITLSHNGNDYTLIQQPKKLIWINTNTWNWTDVADDPSWSMPTVNGNILTWRNVFPGVDYRVRKSNGAVAHGIFFKPAFLDSAVTLYDQRSDAAYIALGNVTEYSFSANIDNPDSALGNLNRRTLKRIGSMLFKLRKQTLRTPGQDTVSVTQRWIKANGRIYCVEYVMMSQIKSAHEEYPNATLWHNATASWTTTIIDTRLEEGAPTGSFYSLEPLAVYAGGGGSIRYVQTLLYFIGVIDSISGWSSVDSALLELHYHSIAAGQDRIVVYRMIADASWYKADSQNCTYNSRYDDGTDSLQWTAGWGDWSSTFTEVNNAQGVTDDSSATGYIPIVITDLVGDIKTAGTDYGLWCGSGAAYNRVAFDGAGDGDGDYPLLYIEGTTGGEPAAAGARRRGIILRR